MATRLEGVRVLLTQADDYMGPAIGELFSAEGAKVHASTAKLADQAAVDAVLAEAGELDVLVANLALPPLPAAVEEIRDEDWFALHDALVHPLMRLVRGVVPAMKARGKGKVVAVTSAAPLRGIAAVSAYCSARGAQNAFVRAAGLDLARHNIQCNAIAQNYVNNPTYYPKGLVESEQFKKHLSRNVPLGRTAESSETAELALFLASPNSDFLVGQVIPFAGGWA